MRLDERGGLLPVSVVTNLVPNGQAALAGVEIGCIVMGINGERWAKNVRCSPASISLSSLCALKLSFSQVYQSCPHHLYAQARQEANKNEVSLWGLTHRSVFRFWGEKGPVSCIVDTNPNPALHTAGGGGKEKGKIYGKILSSHKSGQLL